MLDKLTPKQRRQAEAYREAMGEAATERALAEGRRCTYCGGKLPGQHSAGCRVLRRGQAQR